MKKPILVLMGGMLVATCFFIFIFHKILSKENVSISVQESNNSYSLVATYERYKSRKLEKYIDAQLRTHYFTHKNKVDGMFTLDDHTSMYLRTAPGKLYLKLDKKENDLYSYVKVKKLGEGIKLKLTEN